VIKAIIFDCFGVLTTDVWRAFIDSLPPTADVERARDLNHALDAGMISQAEFLQGVAEATGVAAPEIEKTLGGEVVKNLPLLGYIGELKQQGYAIGLLSNISSNWIQSQFLTPAERDLFDEMILSYEVGMTKPDPRIFMLACERLRVGPHEAVLVDDIEGYIAAAQAEGLKGVVYRDLEQLKQALSVLLNTNDKPLGGTT
jgi:FMN phosphatase YigB (HAD superfamily)